MATLREPSPMAAAASSVPERTIHVGTRKSLLARIQADMVVEQLKAAWPGSNYEIHAISTMGDKNQVSALHDFGAKSLWTFELEKMLVEKEIDLIVHCLKDIPTQLPAECMLGAILEREDPRDALVLHPNLPADTSLSSLPENSIIGTSSVRRSAQLKRLYPHLRFQSVRGNVGTRLQKLDSSDLSASRAVDLSSGSRKGDAVTVDEQKGTHFSAIILAAAGLIRLGLQDRISKFLSDVSDETAEGPQEDLRTANDGMLYAVGQGALAIEIRRGDADTAKLLAPLQSHESGLACISERSLMRTLEGGCSVPIGVRTRWSSSTTVTEDSGSKEEAEGRAGLQSELGGYIDSVAPPRSGKLLVLKGIVVSLDGNDSAEAEISRTVGTEIEADQLGWDVARLLMERGAGDILDAINLNRKIVEGQGDA